MTVPTKVGLFKFAFKSSAARVAPPIGIPLTDPVNVVLPVTVTLPPTEAVPVIARGALILTFLIPVPEIAIDGVCGAVNRLALRRIE